MTMPNDSRDNGISVPDWALPREFDFSDSPPGDTGIPDGPAPTRPLRPGNHGPVGPGMAGGMPVREVPIPRHWTAGAIPPAYIEGERRRYYGPIAHSTYAHLQRWMSIEPELGVDYELALRMPPYTLAFDFQTLEPSDEITIRTEIEVSGPNPDQFTWRIQEIYRIGILFQGGRPLGAQRRVDPTVTPRTMLTVNGEPVSAGRFLTIEPLSGPWPARMIYRQTGGMNKFVRFMMMEGPSNAGNAS